MYRLQDTKHPIDFPDDFETTPEGLLAYGGNLDPATLINAYSKGLFPWFSEDDPILWWHPQPRLVIIPTEVHIATRLSRFLEKKCHFHGVTLPKHRLDWPNPTIELVTTINRDFSGVISQCQTKRTEKRTGTWITNEMLESYSKLHAMGFAHSVEIWDKQDQLVGGMYGIAMGRVFFGESMFSHKDNTSKIALIHLCQFLSTHQFLVLDCQVESPHLLTLGAKNISRTKFLHLLHEGQTYLKKPSECFRMDSKQK